MTTYANLYIDQGSDYETSIVIEDSAGDPLVLNDLEFHGQIRRTPQSDTAYDFEIIKSTSTIGGIIVKLDRDTSLSMYPGRYVYDIFALDQGFNTRFKVLEGIVEVIAQVSRIENV